MLKLVTDWFLLHFSFPLVSRTSEGVIAYFWSQFDIPVEELEIVPEFSEERVLEALENGLKEQRLVSLKIIEVTASRRCHEVWGGVHIKGQKGRVQLGVYCSWLQI